MGIQICQLNLDESGREREVRGTPMFPCAAYCTDLAKNVTGDVPWHWHEEIEILVVRRGRTHIKLDGMEITLGEHEGLFINSGVLHTALIADPGGCVIDSFVFFSHLLSGMPESVFEQKYIRPLISCSTIRGIPLSGRTGWKKDAVTLIEEAYGLFETQVFGYELMIREKLSALWLLLLTHLEPSYRLTPEAENQDSIRIKSMMNHIHEHFSQSVTLLDIADSAHLSERECLRCFKKSLGMSPIQYLMKYRVSKAAGLLSATDTPVTVIASCCGFDSPSYFTQIFRRQFGQTPREYRKERTAKVIGQSPL